uniref:Vacuolar protein sorting-associated protein 35 n=1 Tax=Brassica campestris TaxID=3711 RepID=M4F6V8_BRACM
MIADDDEKWLAAATAAVKQNAFYMQRAIDSNNLKDALKFSAQMLGELRTSKLSPHKYYELYIRASDELRSLEMFFRDETARGCSIAELYELVQHAGNILPRLYLLCTIGSVYIKSKDVTAKDILKDLVEMCRAVQHPLRGLFLRSYLAQVTRDKLPSIGSELEGDTETHMDALEFVLQNFTEMNKLWVRMQHQGPTREKEKREKERNELRDLVMTVGKNLHILGQLEGVDLVVYRDTVLPRILEQVVNCKDELAQCYLMDCIIQVFPDDFHLQTLDVLLGACPQLQPSVDIKMVLSGLMERLSNYAASSVEALPNFLQVDAFSKLNHAIGKVVEAQVDLPASASVTLYLFLLKFTLHVHSDRLDYVDQVLGSCVSQLSATGKLCDDKASKQIVAFLSAPLEKFNDVVTILKLTNYPRVMEYLDHDTNKTMAIIIIQSILKNDTRIATADEVDALFELIKGLIKDFDGLTDNDEIDEEDFQEEQNSVARLVHFLYNDDPEEMSKIIFRIRKHILTGGPKRLPLTIPPLVFSALKLIRRMRGGDENPFGDDTSTPQKILQLLTETVEVLSDASASELALRLYLQCAQAANDCELETVAYEFFTKAYLLYEEEISDSKAQVTALRLIIGTLQRMRVFNVENRDILTHKATGYSAKLLKKPDQCRAVYECAHLYWAEEGENLKDGERVVLCLKRAQKIADAVQKMANASRGASSTGSVSLYVELLNKYLYFLEKGNPQVTGETIQSLAELIRSETKKAESGAGTFITSTLRYMEFQRQQEDGGMSEKYQKIKMEWFE